MKYLALSTLTALALLTGHAAPALAQGTPPVSLSVGIDVTNQYMFRGIRQHETGASLWPAVELGVAAFEGEGGLKSLGLTFGNWNALNTEYAGNKLYESDFYATLDLGFGGGVGLGTTYTSYTSPNSAFTHVKELAFTLSHDSLLAPYVMYARELGTSEGAHQADGGHHAGNYIELGIEPGYEMPRASLAFPVKVGLSANHYYELDGTDNRFGFFSIGGAVTVPFGSYFAVRGGAEFLTLGETTKAFNNGRRTQGIVSVGVGVGF